MAAKEDSADLNTSEKTSEMTEEKGSQEEASLVPSSSDSAKDATADEATEVKSEPKAESVEEAETNPEPEQQAENKSESPQETEAQKDEVKNGEEKDGNTTDDEDDLDDEHILTEYDPKTMGLLQRTQLFAKGREYQDNGKKKMALKCYLRCLKGLEKTNGFTSLPQCLRNVADIYYGKGEYEKAIQFIQAEKIFYETALIDASQLAKQLESYVEGGAEEEADNPDLPKVNPEVVRADEYEKLARMCLEKKQPKLALEYQAKATKLRQKVLGDDHPITTESLDFFTVVYAEVGKIQYSESMKKLDASDLTPEDTTENKTPENELRRRKRGSQNETGQNSSHDEENNPIRQAEIREQEEWISRTLLMVLFVLSVLVVLATGFFVYCRLDPASSSCVSFKRELHYQYMRIKYYFYYYVFPSQNTYG